MQILILGISLDGDRGAVQALWMFTISFFLVTYTGYALCICCKIIKVLVQEPIVRFFQN